MAARPARPERHRQHRAGVAGQRLADRGAGGRVPQPHRPVAAGGGEQRPPPARSERHRRTPRVWPFSGWPTGAPVAGSHSRTVPSAPAEASSGCPPAPARTPPTSPRRCGRSAAGRPGRRWPGPTAAPSRRRWRRRAAAPSRPGPNATDSTALVWPVSGWPTGCAGGRVPQPHRPVVAGGGEQRRAVRPGPNATDSPRWCGRSAAGRPGRRWPGPTAAPSRRRRRRRAAAAARPGAERHRRTPRVWPFGGWPTGAPVAGSHSRTVPSRAAEASSGCPPARHRTPPTTPRWCGRSAAGRPGRRWPGPTAAPSGPSRRRRAAAARPPRCRTPPSGRCGCGLSAAGRPGRRWPGPTAAPSRRRRRRRAAAARPPRHRTPPTPRCWYGRSGRSGCRRGVPYPGAPRPLAAVAAARSSAVTRPLPPGSLRSRCSARRSASAPPRSSKSAVSAWARARSLGGIDS